jgi:uncharacterized protein
MNMDINAYRKKIEAFCRQWKVVEFSFFGSVLRNDFSNESDIDVLLEFQNDSGYSLFDMVAMQEELKAIFGRDVDIIEKAAMRNPYRRHAILQNRKIMYAT